MTRHLRCRTGGFSLIEALVALAVMAIGMLGVVGVQSTLRLSSDVAKQRSEAVRLAQQSIEDTRSFTLVEPMAGFLTYADIQSVANQQIPGYASNTAYLLNYVVSATGDTGDSVAPRLKSLRVTVGWLDRTGALQGVELNTATTRIMPEFAATVALASNIDVNGMPTRGPQGRNVTIPATAVDFGNGTSGFIPPQAPGGNVVWLMNNSTALISACTLVNAALPLTLANVNVAGCTGTLQLLSGFVAFGAANFAALNPAQQLAEALSPSGVVQASTVSLTQTFPAAGAVACNSAAPLAGVSTVAYFCAVPVQSNSVPPLAWSGSSQVGGLAGAPVVCRYTGIAAPVPNALHPLNYSLVSGPLVQQNFLVLPLGSACPGPLSATLTTATP